MRYGRGIAATQTGMQVMEVRIAYMTGQYPRATATFIHREVVGLRRRGLHVETFAARAPRDHEYIVAEQQEERDNAYSRLPPGPLKLLGAHARMLARGPGRYFSALALAVRTRAPGFKSLLWQGFYFAEAAMVADRVIQRRLAHLHNNFADSSCSVAMLASAMGGFDFSFTMHGPAEFFEPHRWRLDEKIKRARFVICISHFCQSQAMIFSPEQSWDRLRIVHCGVDPRMYTPRVHDGQGKEILFVGRLARVKGLPVLIDAMALLKEKHPEFQLTIAGDGPDRSTIEQQIARLGLQQHVRILGYQSEGQVRDLLAQSDVFAMASFAEGIPVVLMEAMASGVPVVAPSIAGIPELVEDGRSGFIVPPADPGSLADGIDRLLRDPELRSRFATEGRAKVEREFTLDGECEGVARILNAAVAREGVPDAAGGTHAIGD
jgi:glycosyltransferase involved in cell wall biosynthesis